MRDNGFSKNCKSGNIMLNTFKEANPSPCGGSHSTEEYESIMTLIRESSIDKHNLVHRGARFSEAEIEELTKESGL